MSQLSRLIDDHMTPSPYRIEHTDSLARAREMMAEYDIRHLPVMDGERIVGVISDRDLAMFECMDGFDTTKVDVGFVMTDKPYTVEVGTDLAQVAVTMRIKKIGSAVVTDGGQLVGLFTTVDALKVLERLLA